MSMEVVILCGGNGTRMWPKTELVPKAMIEIGGKPILWHIMKLFSKNGHKDFKLLVGFNKEMIMEFFDNIKNIESDWNIEYSDAGTDASKGDRMRHIYKEEKIKGEKFILAYGDDLCSVNINDVISQHNSNGALVTITSVKLVSDYGILDIDGDKTIKGFKEKPVLDYWINGGYIIMEKSVIPNHMIGNNKDETDVFEQLAKEKKVQVFKHSGFWRTMNTIKDLKTLEDLYNDGELKKQLHHS